MHKRCRVLVVDQDELVLFGTALVLERAGYEVITCSPRDAAARIASEQPRVVLVDPDDDPNVARLVERTRERDAAEPGLLLLHGKSRDDELTQMTLVTGADGYVAKRHRLDGLPAAIAAFVPVVRVPARPRVLVVDDDPVELALFSRLIGNEVQGEYLRSGKEALARLTSETPPSVVLAELALPGLSGLELYRAARALDDSWRDRFLLVSAHEPRAAPASDDRPTLLRKPLTSSQLRGVIARTASVTRRAG